MTCPVCHSYTVEAPLFHLLTFQYCPTCKEDIEVLKSKVLSPKKKQYQIGGFVKYVTENLFYPELVVGWCYDIKDPKQEGYALTVPAGCFLIRSHMGTYYTFHMDSSWFIPACLEPPF